MKIIPEEIVDAVVVAGFLCGIILSMIAIIRGVSMLAESMVTP